MCALLALVALAGSAAAQDVSDEQVIARFLARLDRLEQDEFKAPEPSSLKLMYLQGGKAERDELGKASAEAMTALDALAGDVDATLVTWREDLLRLATTVPQLEALRRQLDYKRAWLVFQRGLALDAAAGRSQFRIARELALEFVDLAAPVGCSARLLAGMCARRLGEWEQAEALLLPLGASGDLPPSLRSQAMFERTCTLVEWGRFAEAARAMVDFRTRSPALLGEAREMEIDVKTVMLMMHLYETQAAAEKDPDAAAACRAAVQQAPLELLRKYAGRAGVQAALLDVLAARYGEREDLERLGSPILLGAARRERAAGQDQALTKAERLLRTILDRKDPVSRELAGDATWELAMVMNARRLDLQAARLFAALASEHPSHRLAGDAARNAVYSYRGVLDAHRRGRELVAGDLRREFIAALETLVTAGEGNGELARWQLELGWQYQALGGADDRELLARAIDAYGRVPAGSECSMEARHLALELRARLLAAEPSVAAAGVLVSDLDAYARDAATAASKADHPQARRLRDWGARAAFRAGVIVCDVLDDPAAGDARLAALATHWPGAEVLPEACEFEITRLLDRERTAEAIEKIDAFREEYRHKAHALILLLVRQVRGRIEQLGGDPSRAGELQAYREAFYRFGRELYDAALARNLPDEEMYAFEQMWGEALLAGDRPQEALAMFERCEQFDANRRRAAAARIREETTAATAGARAAAGDGERLLQLAGEYFDRLREDGVVVDDLAEGLALREAMDCLAAAGADECAAARAVLVECLSDATEARGRRRAATISADAGNVLGLARAQRALGQYERAAAYYRRLAGGIDKSEHPSLYWKTQLERCACLLDAAGGAPGRLAALAVLVRQLRFEDPQMGGLEAAFAAIECGSRPAAAVP